MGFWEAIFFLGVIYLMHRMDAAEADDLVTWARRQWRGL